MFFVCAFCLIFVGVSHFYMNSQILNLRAEREDIMPLLLGSLAFDGPDIDHGIMDTFLLEVSAEQVMFLLD